MFSGLIPGLNSINLLDDDLVSQVPASLLSLGYVSDPYITFFRRELIDAANKIFLDGYEIVALIIFLASLLWITGSCIGATVISEDIGEELFSDAETWDWSFLNNDGEDDDEDEDEDYKKKGLLINNGKEVASTASESFCEICMENRERQQMFINNTCSHSFCCDCISKHIIAKIRENATRITCPGINCKNKLDSGTCRSMVPKDVLIIWDETLCKALIPESQKVYCPFRDCSTMLVNDSGRIFKKVKCPICRRSFCARCRVPWHSSFGCKEFRKLNEENGGGVDVLVEKLAKKKRWRKCPNCEFYVEKTAGCSHITCRCAYQFCYSCGSEWSPNHTRACNERSPSLTILNI